MKTVTTNLTLLFENARKSSTYKSQTILIQFWEIVLKNLREKKMTLGQLARKSKVRAKKLKRMMEWGEDLNVGEMGRILAVLETEIVVKEKDVDIS